MSDEEFYFESPIQRLNDWMRMHVVRIPDAVADAMKATGARRFVGTMNGMKVNRAMQFREEVGYIFTLGNEVLTKARLSEGDLVALIVRVDPNPDHIELPETFEQVLEQDEEAHAKWEALTPGSKRSLVHYLNTAKRHETKIKRALEVAHKLKTDGFYKG